MNKTELIKKVSDRTGLTQVCVSKIFDTIIEEIANALGERQKVTIMKFGTFSLQQRSKRRGRNPQTGETMEVPAKTVTKFTPGQALKEKTELLN